MTERPGCGAQAVMRGGRSRRGRSAEEKLSFGGNQRARRLSGARLCDGAPIWMAHVWPSSAQQDRLPDATGWLVHSGAMALAWANAIALGCSADEARSSAAATPGAARVRSCDPPGCGSATAQTSSHAMTRPSSEPTRADTERPRAVRSGDTVLVKGVDWALKYGGGF